MPARSRSYAVPSNEGIAKFDHPTSGFQYKGRILSTGTCTDTINQAFSDNPLVLNHRRISGAIINGVNGRVSFKDYPARWAHSFGLNHLVLDKSNYRSAAEAVADQNPSRPSVDVPQFLFELKDVPYMLRHLAKRANSRTNRYGFYNHKDTKRFVRSLPKNVSEDFLHYYFGWDPLLRDLISIAGIVPELEARAAEIQSHRTPSGALRYRSTLGESSKSASTAETYDSTMFSWFGRSQTITENLTWVTSRWVANSYPDFSSTMNNERQRLIRAVLGAELSYSLFWEIMPWSWLIDWFTDIGSYLSINRNVAGYRLSSVCTMSHTKTVSMITPNPVTYGTVRGTMGVKTLETKTRAVGPLLPASPTVPILGSGQLGVLHALAVTRLPKHI